MSKKILLIEDNLDIQCLIERKLKKLEYEVIKADNGWGGLEAFSEEKPDLVLTDVVLPDMEGFEVCRKIREKNKRVKIVIYTARIQVADAHRAQEVGADDLTLKSENLSGIIDAVQGIFSK